MTNTQTAATTDWADHISRDNLPAFAPGSYFLDGYYPRMITAVVAVAGEGVAKPGGEPEPFILVETNKGVSRIPVSAVVSR
ncbi:hypothetical protein [uncultured Arsenicicoccus sp.]|uniref:hypothetical protein n=1 Tax=uncultured Arsenicicoccus sp. TaxID=491339 RepID=UPI00259A00CB|nr:hypothetical protein [uncultured Arsenicicoccus sp.]